MKKVSIIILIIFTFAVCRSIMGDENNCAVSGDLVIFHAGSLAVPFQQITEIFAREYPDVRILRESAGSIVCARKISNLNRLCDIVASSDYTVIDQLLIPEHANWNLKFVSNEMTIAFTDASRRAQEITHDNWYEILLDKNVTFGRSDPNTDPCGYRSIFTIKLSEIFYDRDGLLQKFLAKDMNYIRPKEVGLLALLELHDLDYIFIYRSVAQQHGLNCIHLPDEINLKKPELSDYYKKVSVQISGNKPGSSIAVSGKPIVYSVTIPKNSPNPSAALEFVKFLLSKDKGLAVLERNGHTSLVPAPTDTYKELPEILKEYATER